MRQSHFLVVCAAVLLILTGAIHADGKSTYDSSCSVCHAAGVAGAPKLDDKEAWAERIAQGQEVLVKRAIEGFQGKTGVMPPKGGFVQLSDSEVEAAVQYMVEQAQQ